MGGTVLRNVQPLFADLAGGGFAVAHNGNLTNGLTLREDLVERGSIFQSTSTIFFRIRFLCLSYVR